MVTWQPQNGLVVVSDIRCVIVHSGLSLRHIPNLREVVGITSQVTQMVDYVMALPCLNVTMVEELSWYLKE